MVATEIILPEQFICQYRGLLTCDEPADNTIYVYEFVYKRKTYWYVHCKFILFLSLVCYCNVAFCCMLSYTLLGVWNLALCGDGANVVIKQVSHID